MLISLNKIKQYVGSIPVSDEELVKLIGSRLVEVEGVMDMAEKYRGAYLAKVVTCEDISGTHLHLCQIDAGPELNQKFSTLDSGLVQIVCGAPNVRAGIIAVWLTPGSIVPDTFGGENFMLGSRKLRGYESFGMLAGPDELGLSSNHKYIAEVDESLGCPGQALADVFDLNDKILDIENKSLTHRPDTFGLIGFAREVSGILGQKFSEPVSFDQAIDKISDEITIEIADQKLCPRYSACLINVSDLNLANPVSPEFSDLYPMTKDSVLLAKSGINSVSPIVDATNLTMLELGQPLHAFDYDKFVKIGGLDHAKIIVRAARTGESLTLLDGKTIELNTNDIVIASNDIPVALAGAMGGESTKIDASTTRILLESATFSLYNLRKTQMAHGIFSEAITRFTKGQPALNTIPAIKDCLTKLDVKSGAELRFADSLKQNLSEIQVAVKVSEINQLLGSNYDEALMVQTLENVGFKVISDSEKLFVTAPLWRTDIHIKEDIIEEVGRLLGFDNLPLSLPSRPFIGAEKNAMFELKTTLRNLLSLELGLHEVLTYSFISKKLLERVGENTEDAYEITNSISPELQLFRTSITPSLLEKVRENQKAGFADFSLYEMNQITRKSLGLNADQTPKMQHHLAVVSTADYYYSKQILENLADKLGLNFEIQAFSDGEDSGYFEPKRAAKILLSGTQIGCLGELKNSVKTALKLKEVSSLELDLESLLGQKATDKRIKEFSRFPAVNRDLTVKISEEKPFALVENAIFEVLKIQPSLIFHLTATSIYQAEGADTKNLSFHLNFASTEKTLLSEEISAIMNSINQSLEKIGGEII